MPRISVIIPTLNEADRIGAVVESLSQTGVDEIWVADGQSEDGTVRVARGLECEVIELPAPNRARQMNAGAEKATGDVLLFLHADTLLNEAAVISLRRAMDEVPEVVGGGFVRTFDSPSLFLKCSCWLASLRGRFGGYFLGDQALFARREAFEVLRGFDEGLEVGEDLDFSVRLRSVGKTTILGPRIISSARRFDRYGVLQQTWKDGLAAIKIIRKTRKRRKE